MDVETEFIEKEGIGLVKVRYIGGHPSLRGPRDVTVQRKGDKVEILAGWGNTVIIGRESFGPLDYTRQERRSTTKAAAGALIGGALAGPAGLIIGGALGARGKQANTVSIPVIQGQLSYSLIFECNDKQFNTLVQEIYG
ncbi:MAG TPA: hypothetical protein GXX40_05710 [Firmicutes bacterium]|nr:hypothetical protein [Bacillota bacterium]